MASPRRCAVGGRRVCARASVRHPSRMSPPLLALLPLALRLARARARATTACPPGAHVRRLDLDRLAAVELHRVAPLAPVLLVPVEVDGDAALPVHVRAARAVDLHPLVHEGLQV